MRILLTSVIEWIFAHALLNFSRLLLNSWYFYAFAQWTLDPFILLWSFEILMASFRLTGLFNRRRKNVLHLRRLPYIGLMMPPLEISYLRFFTHHVHAVHIRNSFKLFRFRSIWRVIWRREFCRSGCYFILKTIFCCRRTLSLVFVLWRTFR